MDRIKLKDLNDDLRYYERKLKEAEEDPDPVFKDLRIKNFKNAISVVKKSIERLEECAE